jgi:uncharacterized protein YbjT (DUF2867 family)
MSSMKQVLVLGGTGFVGRAACECLAELAPATRVRVPTRRAAHGNSVRFLPNVDLLSANVHDEAALRRLVAGCDAVVNLVAILHGSAAAFEQVHVALPRKLAQACQAAGVRRLVHVSALGVGPGAPSNYLRSKTAGEAVLQEAKLDLTVLRPSVIFGVDDHFLNLFAQLQAVAPVFPLAGSDARFQPVWVQDVAQGIVAALMQPQSIGQVIECAGPDVLTLSELVRLSGRWAGVERAQIPLPAAVGRLQAAMMEWLPGEPLMSRDNVDSMRVPNVASGKLPGLQSLGITPAAVAAVAPGYLGRHQGVARLDVWRRLARRD